MLSKIWVWNPESGKNLFGITDPEVKKAPDPGSGSATLIKFKFFSEQHNLEQYECRRFFYTIPPKFH
jgi:hypothetical protein